MCFSFIMEWDDSFRRKHGSPVKITSLKGLPILFEMVSDQAQQEKWSYTQVLRVSPGTQATGDRPEYRNLFFFHLHSMLRHRNFFNIFFLRPDFHILNLFSSLLLIDFLPYLFKIWWHIQITISYKFRLS